MKRIALLAALATAGCSDQARPPISERPARVATPPAPNYETDVAPTLERLCLPCHDRATSKGGIALDGEAPGPEAWGRIADALRAGTMPPAGRPGPSPAELVRLGDWLDAEVFLCSGDDRDPGRVTLRRLNRAEYDRTIRDLVGIDLRLAADFPADDVGYGFDHIGDVLSLPPILVEKYLRAADRAIAEAASDPRAWSRLMNPGPDAVPLPLRKPTYASRSEPVKRIGRPAALPPPSPVEDPEALALGRARAILRGFADRAFRRPATIDELDRLVGLVESARKDGDPFDEAVREGLKAVLVAPAFLFHVEEESEDVGDGRARPLGEFALASRLSYFLWSSLPDEELYRLAVRAELRRPGVLAGQVRRMLGDDKARALVENFAAQWLEVRRLAEVTPDPDRFPDFDEPLRRSMIGETLAFASAILLEDGRGGDFLDAEFTFVDERLARHYGIPGVTGSRFRRVSLAGTGRVGILGHASVLTITSNPTRTSPVKRGKWVLDNLLGMPPPPPPEGVEGLKGDESAGSPATLRDRMDQHRSEPACASCHARMDPLGFALEEFDGIGAWRVVEDGRPIDASGSFPGGERFRGASGLRDVLVARRAAFERCLAEKLLTYALGRGLVPADRCSVDEVVRKLDRGDGRAVALILGVVESPPFQSRSRSKEAR